MSIEKRHLRYRCRQNTLLCLFHTIFWNTTIHFLWPVSRCKCKWEANTLLKINCGEFIGASSLNGNGKTAFTMYLGFSLFRPSPFSPVPDSFRKMDAINDSIHSNLTVLSNYSNSNYRRFSLNACIGWELFSYYLIFIFHFFDFLPCHISYTHMSYRRHPISRNSILPNVILLQPDACCHGYGKFTRFYFTEVQTHKAHSSSKHIICILLC